MQWSDIPGALRHDGRKLVGVDFWCDLLSLH